MAFQNVRLSPIYEHCSNDRSWPHGVSRPHPPLVQDVVYALGITQPDPASLLLKGANGRCYRPMANLRLEMDIGLPAGSFAFAKLYPSAW